MQSDRAYCSCREASSFATLGWIQMRKSDVAVREKTLCSPYRKKRPQKKCHLSDKMCRFSDNLPRCQASLANQLSHINWRGIIFLFPDVHSPSLWLSFLVSRQDMREKRQIMALP